MGDASAGPTGFFPFSTRAACLQAAADMLAAGQPGVCLLGDPGAGKSAMLDRLLAGLPTGVLAARLAAEAGPEDVASLIGQAKQERVSAGHAGHLVIAVDDADLLRRDTLDLLDKVAGLIAWGGAPGVQFLMTGRMTFFDRLTGNGNSTLTAYLASPLSLPPLTGDDAAAFLAWLRAKHPVSGIDDSAILSGASTPGIIVQRLQDAVDAAAAPRPRPVAPAKRPAKWIASGGFGLAAAVLLLALLLRPSIEPATPPPPPQAASPAPAAPPEQTAIAPAPAPAPAPKEQVEVADPHASAPPSPAPVQPPAASPAPKWPGVSPPSRVMLTERGLVLVAERGDTLQTLYRHVYRGVRPPSFDVVQEANPFPIRPGTLVVFPSPPDGWRHG